MKCFICWLFLLPLIGYAQTYDLVSLNSGTNASLRGMSIVTDDVAWVSGSKGHIGKTTDGGKTWQWVQPAGYAQLDFRDIQGFDSLKAVAINAGSPAYVLLTVDGGKTWTERYKNTDSAIFLDGMDFWDKKNGIIFGDPILNEMQLLRTQDGGLSWNPISGNLKTKLNTGEAGFAASGTTIKTLPGGKVWIATGGAVAQIYYSDNYAYTWKVFKCPIIQGKSSTGTFAMDFYNGSKGVVVGGDYLKDKENLNNVLLTDDGGKNWKRPAKPVSGYRSGVIYVNSALLIATGSSGTDVSKDAGQNWINISGQGFNVIGKSKKGKLILLAGNKGEIYKLAVKP
ncbi:WD40/YVTN/BNR-like repeat-containing protein [Pedobacter sp. MC2016-24]|uniref:WD40/YVTN/BNR-like repeat-containing protein n=1 Tax=Pedobacter sp. MC2016-24 TaxID=2780090 RepID=UPI00351C64A3